MLQRTHLADAASTTVHVLHRDYETRSRVNLKIVGAQQYAADPTTEVLCCCYAVDDEPVKLWRPGDLVPPEFIAAAQNPSWLVVAHNDAFETAIEKCVLGPQYRWPTISSDRHRCTMAMSLACGLPARLGTVADVLELAHRKDAVGERLMHQMSKPRRAHKDEDPAGIYWFGDQDRLERLYDYCRQDVEVERELHGRLPPLSEAEQTIWQLNHQINVRGYYINRAFAEAAQKIAEQAGPEINAEVAELTGGDVTSINQVAKLTAWLHDHGCALPSLDQKAIEKWLLKGDDELSAPVRRVLELRRSGAQAAAKKINALLARAGADDRIRGGFRYHGAATGRWSGEGVQAQNLKKAAVEDLEAATAAIATGDYDHVKKLYPRPLAVIGDCSRSMICAAPGKVLIGADFSAIESRVLA
jgi:DNA polymerase